MAVGPIDRVIDTFTAFTPLPLEKMFTWLPASKNKVDEASNGII